MYQIHIRQTDQFVFRGAVWVLEMKAKVLIMMYCLYHREEDNLVAMLRLQEYEHTTVDSEGAMGLAAILTGQLPELKGKRWAALQII